MQTHCLSVVLQTVPTLKILLIHIQASTFTWHLKMSRWYELNIWISYANYYSTKGLDFQMRKWSAFGVVEVHFSQQHLLLFFTVFPILPKGSVYRRMWALDFQAQQLVPIRKLNVWWTCLWVRHSSSLQYWRRAWHIIVGCKSQDNNLSELWKCWGKACSWRVLCFKDRRFAPWSREALSAG